MRSRLNIWGLGVSLCPALTVLTLGGAAFAQDEGQPEETTTAADTAETSGAPEEASDAAEEEAEEAAPAPPKAEPAPPAEAAQDTSPLPVHILAGLEMPGAKVRGITGGSLWLTTQGLQWPYMPKLPGGDRMQIAISGSAWVDTSYARINSGSKETDPSQKRWANQGRGVLRATPAYSTEEGWFAQGQIEFVANGDQTLTGQNLGVVDDMFVRAGKWGLFDVTVGRFQGWELYHYGMGLDLNTLERRGAEGRNAGKPPQIYGLDFFWDRPNDGRGNYAVHFYPTDFLRFEVLGQVGTSSGNNQFAVRPVGILDLGFVKVKAGAELGKNSPQQDEIKGETSMNGWGVAVQGVLDPHVEAGVNVATGYTDAINNQGLPDLARSTTTMSYGGFLNGRVFGPLIIGGGANMTRFNSLQTNGITTSPNYGKHDVHTHFQAFVAVQYSVWDRFFVKFVGARAVYDYEDYVREPPHGYTYDMWSGRFRVMYLF